MNARQRRRRVYHKASAIARAIRTSDFPHAVQIVANMIAADEGRKRKLSKLQQQEGYERLEVR